MFFFIIFLLGFIPISASASPIFLCYALLFYDSIDIKIVEMIGPWNERTRARARTLYERVYIIYQINSAEWIPGDLMAAAYPNWSQDPDPSGLEDLQHPSPNIHPGSISSWMPIISALPRPYTIWYINIWEAQYAESSILHPLLPTNHLC